MNKTIETAREHGPFYAALGHTIKVARTDLGIERNELADRAGISYSYLAAIENGKKQPSSQVVLAIAEALGLRSHELLESAEGRRERNLSATEEYPSWLLGRSRRTSSAESMRDRAMEARRSGSAAKPSPFLEEMEQLNRTITESDRELLLGMARKLAQGR